MEHSSQGSGLMFGRYVMQLPDPVRVSKFVSVGGKTSRDVREEAIRWASANSLNRVCTEGLQSCRLTIGGSVSAPKRCHFELSLSEELGLRRFHIERLAIHRYGHLLRRWRHNWG